MQDSVLFRARFRPVYAGFLNKTESSINLSNPSPE
jgi:hypothetical protein